MILKDQMNRNIQIKKYPPEKIISIVPSITELLAFLGLEQNIIGITKFCIHPEHIFKSKEKIGGTKNLNIEKIKSLNPDLIIGNKEENVKQQIEELSQYFPVWMSDVNSYEDALYMIESIGKLTNTSNCANQLIADIEQAFETTNNKYHILKNKKVIYLIWYKPYMAVGKNTYIDNILSKIQSVNLIQKERYSEINTEEIKSLNPDYVLLSSEPFPFKDKHKEELEQILSHKTKVIIVSGEMFSWYGVKMKYLPEYLLKIET